MNKLLDAAIAAGATVSTSESSDLAPGSILFHSQAQLDAAFAAHLHGVNIQLMNVLSLAADKGAKVQASLWRGAVIGHEIIFPDTSNLEAYTKEVVALAVSHLPERKLHEASRDAAVDTLVDMGYEYNCSPRWKPPIGKAPVPAFRVTVNPLRASNGLTYVVTLDQGTRPGDAMPWDDGRITPINRNNVDEANSEGAEWAKFLGVPFTPCAPVQDAATKNTVPEYGDAALSSATGTVGGGDDECAATGQGHSLRDCGPKGERQCQYCGEPAVSGHVARDADLEVELWATDQGNGRDWFVRKCKFSEAQAECARMTNLGRDYWIKDRAAINTPPLPGSGK